MASLNKVMLIGNITRDPEVRYTPKGKAVCDLGLAINSRYTTESGEKEVTFVDVVLWEKQAELVGQYLHKGSPIFIEGRLQMHTWEEKATGQKRSKIKIVCENMQFIDSKGGGQRGGGDADDEGGASRPASRPAQRPAAAGAAARPAQRPQQGGDEFSEGPITDGMEEDDIPF